MSLKVKLGIGLPFSPWREPNENFKWEKETAEKLQEEVNSIKPTDVSGINKFTALIIGTKGHGKSSLINSFASLSLCKKTTASNASSVEGNVTKNFKKYEFIGQFEHCAFGDTNGIPENDDIFEPYLEDIKLILQGHIKSGYEFDPKKSISPENEYYVQSPTLSDRIHCVILVIDSTQAYDLQLRFRLKLARITDVIYSLNIPVIGVLTKADLLSENVKYDVAAIFRSKGVHQVVEKTSNALGIPEPNLHPVVNFEVMDHFTWKESIPTLLALRSCLRMAQLYSHNAD